MDIKCATWDEDLAYLSRQSTILKTTMRVFTQALIHSNLFDAHVSNHGNFKDLTLAEMELKKHKKPFVCAIIEGIVVCCSIIFIVNNTLDYDVI